MKNLKKVVLLQEIFEQFGYQSSETPGSFSESINRRPRMEQFFVDVGKQEFNS